MHDKTNKARNLRYKYRRQLMLTAEEYWNTIKIFNLTSIVHITGVTPGLLLWSPKSPRSYTYGDPRIHIIMSTGCLTNPYQ